jgi:hypothetical protein
VETSGGKQMEFYGSRDMASRGGKGFEAVKRTSFVRIVPPPIELVDWDRVEGKAEERNGKIETNGEQKSLFE